MIRRFLLAAAVVVGTMLAMSPSEADARWGRRYYRAPVRVYAGYGPRVYRSNYRPYYAPRRVYYGPRYYGPAWRGYGGGVSIGPGGVFVTW